MEEKRKELEEKINNAKTAEEIEEIRKEINELKMKESANELRKELAKEENEKQTNDDVDERSLIRDGKEELKIFKEAKEMEERKYTIADKEYRNAWAKKMMGLSDDKFTAEEKRALGDAVTTTALEYVASAEGTQGINNGGLFIPTSVRMELMEIIEKQSPIFRDIRKLQVAGNVDLPYLFGADDAEWYVELTDTKNEGAEFRNLQLTGWELAKDVVITWKLEEMAVESFISFIIDELANKMGRALVNAIIYGDGVNKPTGITNGLTAIKTGDTPIDNIIDTYKSLDEEERIGAKAYISSSVNIAIVGYKDANGNYPFLQGVATNKLVSIEQDPYLKGNDLIVGNAKNYILNEVTQIRIEKERSVKGRKVTYGGYGVFDGKAKPKGFAYGQYTPSV